MLIRAHRAQRKRGAALVASLVVVMTVAFLGAALIQVNASITRQEVALQDEKRAFYVAEAGLSEAFFAIYQGKTGDVGCEGLPARFGDGLFWVEATELEDDRVALTSNGLCGVGRFSLSVVLEKNVNELATLGVFGSQEIVIGERSIIDGYDSQAGSFEAQLDESLPVASTGQGASVNSNGDVQIHGLLESTLGSEASTYVFGDARPGPQGTVSIAPGVIVTGSTAPNLVDLDLPPVEPPEMPSQGILVHDTTIPLVLSNKDLHYERVRVATRASLLIEGPAIIVVDTFILERGATLSIDSSDGPVSIFVTDRVDFRSGSVLGSVNRDPRSVAFTITADSSTTTTTGSTSDLPSVFAPSGEFYGFIYAPHLDLNLPSGLRVLGGLAADRVNLDGGAHVTFDTALTSSESPAIPGLPKLITWRVVELPNSPLVKLRTNPYLLLGLEPSEVPLSHEAHHEQDVTLTYRDTLGVLQTYTGPIDSFDSSDVGRLLSKEWVEDSWDGANTPPIGTTSGTGFGGGFGGTGGG